MTEREIFERMPPGEKVAYVLCHAAPALVFLGAVIWAVIDIAHIGW